MNKKQINMSTQTNKQDSKTHTQKEETHVHTTGIPQKP